MCIRDRSLCILLNRFLLEFEVIVHITFILAQLLTLLINEFPCLVLLCLQRLLLTPLIVLDPLYLSPSLLILLNQLLAAHFCHSSCFFTLSFSSHANSSDTSESGDIGILGWFSPFTCLL